MSMKMCRRCGLVETERRDGLCLDCRDKVLMQQIDAQHAYEDWEAQRRESQLIFPIAQRKENK